MSENNFEIEVKIRLKEDFNRIEEKLINSGFEAETSFQKELNIFYDRNGELKEKGLALRLRYFSNMVSLTLKGKSLKKKIKERKEYEVSVSSFENMDLILKSVGLKPFFKYEKMRKLFRNKNNVLVTLDKTPFGNFMEIEGNVKSIKIIMDEMEISQNDIEEKNYLQLFSEFFGQKK